MIYKIIDDLSIIIGSLAVIIGAWLWSILAVTNYEIDIAAWLPISIVIMAVISFMLHCVACVIFEVKTNKNNRSGKNG